MSAHDEAVHGAAEIGYLTARMADDYLGCVKELISMTVWLPLAGPRRQLVVTHRGGEGLVRAYTSPERASAVRTPDGEPDAVLGRGFLDLVDDWRHPEYGLVINPDSASEFRMPRRVLPKVRNVWESMRTEAGESQATASQTGADSATGGTAPDGSAGPGSEAAGSRTPPVAPIEPPAEIGGFRFVAMMDGLDGGGRPVVSPERPRITDPEEKRRIRGYLEAGETLQTLTGFIPDMYEPSRGDVAPASTRTDGEWIWLDAVAYYLDEYDIGPEPEFYRHIVAQDYRCPKLSKARLKRAGRALEERQRIASSLYAESQDQRPDA